MWPAIISSSVARLTTAAHRATRSALLALRSPCVPPAAPRTMQWTDQRDDWEPDCIESFVASNESWRVQLGMKYHEDNDWEEYADNLKKADL